MSSAARRCPGWATRLRAGNGAGIYTSAEGAHSAAQKSPNAITCAIDRIRRDAAAIGPDTAKQTGAKNADA
jgi:hypothetical protein